MSNKNTIVAVEIQEQEFGEKVVLDSPYESKDYIRHLPWKTYEEEVSEHGSLKAKAESRGTNTKTSELIEVFDAMEQYGFSDDFATHVSWDPEALGPDAGAWTIDVESFEEAKDFFEFCGYSVEVADGVEV
jgi:hypothetical protein